MLTFFVVVVFEQQPNKLVYLSVEIIILLILLFDFLAS